MEGFHLESLSLGTSLLFMPLCIVKQNPSTNWNKKGSQEHPGDTQHTYQMFDHFVLWCDSAKTSTYFPSFNQLSSTWNSIGRGIQSQEAFRSISAICKGLLDTFDCWMIRLVVKTAPVVSDLKANCVGKRMPGTYLIWVICPYSALYTADYLTSSL